MLWKIEMINKQIYEEKIWINDVWIVIWFEKEKNK